MFNAFHILVLAAALCVVMLLVLSSLLSSKVCGVREWMVANLLGGGAFFLYAFGRELPPVVAHEIANSVYAAAAAMLLAGFCRFFSRKVPYGALAIGLALVAMAIAFFHYQVNSFAGRTTVISLFQVAVSLGIAYTVIRARKTGRARYAYWFVTSTACAVAVGHALRAVLHIARSDQLTSLWQLSPLNLVFLCAGTLVLPMLTLGAVMMVHDHLVDQAEHAANRDFLTGVWSRRAFFSLAEKELARARRSGHKLSLLMLDVDRFKSINDRFGHGVGDQVLVQVALRAQGAIRHIDCLGRLGGEEFAVLLPATDLQAAMAVAERLRAGVAGKLPLAEHGRASDGVDVSVSVGAAEWGEDETLQQWLQRADQALYQAKALGRNRVEPAVPAMAALRPLVAVN